MNGRSGQQTRVLGSAPGGAVRPPSRRHWRLLLGGLLGVVAVAATMLLVDPHLRSTAVALGDVAARPLRDLCAAYCPPGAESLVAKAAAVFLTPWLYLLMGVVFVAEKAIPAMRSQPVLSVGMIQDAIGWFTFGSLVRVALIGAFVSGLYWLCDRYLAGIRIEAALTWPVWAAVGAAILAGDFLGWLHHWLRHKIDVFWLFHTIHHSQREMNMFTDLRVHLAEYVIAMPIAIVPLYVVGLDVELAFWLALIVQSYTRVYHANLRTNYGPLRHVLVTPQSHRIHHSSDPRHWDRNFGVLFSVWDRMFGTQWTDYDEYPETGVADERFPHEESVAGLRVFTNYLRQLAYPFQQILSGIRRCEIPKEGAGRDR